MSASAPASSVPGRTSADDDEVQRPLSTRSDPVRVFEHGQYPRAQSVLPRASRAETVPLRPLGVEEVRLRSGRQHEEVALVAVAVPRGHRPVLGSATITSAIFTSTFVWPRRTGEATSRHRRPELRGGDLVEQRLELVVVVLVDHVTRTSSLLASLRAHASPANPPPTITTCFGDVLAVHRPSSTINFESGQSFTLSPPASRMRKSWATQIARRVSRLNGSSKKK